MKPVTRRFVIAGSAAAAATVPVAFASVRGNPKKMVRDLQREFTAAYATVTPITPAEYVSEMEANGWCPFATVWRDGKLMKGIVEYTVSYPPSREDVEFLYYINCRIAKSGHHNFYERVATHLFEQGRAVPHDELQSHVKALRGIS